MKNSIIYKYIIRFDFMEDSVVDRNMQRKILAKANRSLAILGKGLEQHILNLQSFNIAHTRITKYGLWNLFTDEELLKYNPQTILDQISQMHHVETRIILNDATNFYLRIWLNVEGPYSSIIKRKIVSLELYKMGVN